MKLIIVLLSLALLGSIQAANDTITSPVTAATGTSATLTTSTTSKAITETPASPTTSTTSKATTGNPSPSTTTSKAATPSTNQFTPASTVIHPFNYDEKPISTYGLEHRLQHEIQLRYMKDIERIMRFVFDLTDLKNSTKINQYMLKVSPCVATLTCMAPMYEKIRNNIAWCEHAADEHIKTIEIAYRNEHPKEHLHEFRHDYRGEQVRSHYGVRSDEKHGYDSRSEYHREHERDHRPEYHGERERDHRPDYHGEKDRRYYGVRSHEEHGYNGRPENHGEYDHNGRKEYHKEQERYHRPEYHGIHESDHRPEYYGEHERNDVRRHKEYGYIGRSEYNREQENDHRSAGHQEGHSHYDYETVHNGNGGDNVHETPCQESHSEEMRIAHEMFAGQCFINSLVATTDPKTQVSTLDEAKMKQEINSTTLAKANKDKTMADLHTCLVAPRDVTHLVELMSGIKSFTTRILNPIASALYNNEASMLVIAQNKLTDMKNNLYNLKGMICFVESLAKNGCGADPKLIVQPQRH